MDPTTLPLVTSRPGAAGAPAPAARRLECRIGPHLILRDVKPHTILDVLPNTLAGGGEQRHAS